MNEKNLAERKNDFEAARGKTESVEIVFKGDAINGFDVYNCSIPFTWKGKRRIYGRVEKRGEWARSWVRLFEETDEDEFTLLPNGMIYQLEDPFVQKIGGEIVLGGTHVVYSKNTIDTFHGYFYRGSDLEDLRYFTTGPSNMKDIRLLETPKGICVFSRPRNEEVEKKYGSASVIGCTFIKSLDELDENIIANAEIIPGLFGKGEWGGCNQCYLLDSGYIGIIGHKCFASNGTPNLAVYFSVSFVFDYNKNRILDEKIIATRSSYPEGPAKKPELVDCTFTSGIVMRSDGKADLYGGLGDVSQGRVVIGYPFEGYGKIVGGIC